MVGERIQDQLAITVVFRESKLFEDNAERNEMTFDCEFLGKVSHGEFQSIGQSNPHIPRSSSSSTRYRQVNYSEAN